MRVLIVILFFSFNLESQSYFKNNLKFNLIEPFIEGTSFYPFERNFSFSYERVLSFDPRLEQATMQLSLGKLKPLEII